MAIESFGVTASGLRGHHFPHIRGEFGLSTRPSEATVTEMISAAAAELAGALGREGISTSSITVGSTPNAYAWCADTLRLGAAARVARTVAGMRPEAARSWQAEFNARLKMLDGGGYAVLGDLPQPSQEPDGPRSHISNHNLDTGDASAISNAAPRFRRSDEL